MKWLALAALLGAAAHAAPVNSASLTGTTWVISHIAPRGQAITPGELLRKPTLKVMPGGLLIGHTGCNGFSGWATVQGQSMTVKPLTLSGASDCLDHALSLESDFVNLLESATRFEINGQKLTVRGAENRFITFQASRGENSVSENLPQLASMKGDWQLTKLIYRGQVVNVPLDARLTLRDMNDGVEVRGKAGCNVLFGQVALQGRTLSVFSLGTTRMLCEDMRSENAVLDILRVPLSITGDGERMTWRNNRGELTLTRLQRAAPDLTDLNHRNLKGRTFALKTVAGTPVAAVPPLTLTFMDGRVGGFDGCNHFGGEFTWKGSRLHMSMITTTLIGCLESGRPDLTAFLGQQPTAELNGNTLRLTANGVTWEFVAER